MYLFPSEIISGGIAVFEKYNDILSVKEACAALSMGKNTLYKLLQENKLKAIRIGKKYYIPKKFIVDFITKYS